MRPQRRGQPLQLVVNQIVIVRRAPCIPRNASFARLRRLPFNTLKLDQSLVAPVPGQPADLAILRAVRDLGRAVQLRLVAEGVETPAQRVLLAELGFDEAQGYLFGCPMPLEMLLTQEIGAPAFDLPPFGEAAARHAIA
jgi:predicted signal transduction protein with EAL and GGDEF domain